MFIKKIDLIYLTVYKFIITYIFHFSTKWPTHLLVKNFPSLVPQSIVYQR